jgi:hypothetical protein
MEPSSRWNGQREDRRVTEPPSGLVGLSCPKLCFSEGPPVSQLGRWARRLCPFIVVLFLVSYESISFFFKKKKFTNL